MNAKVVGFQKLDYVSKKSGKQVKGVKLYVNTPSPFENVVGCEVKEFWASSNVVESMGFVPDVNSDVELIFDFDGRNSYLIGYKLLDKKSGKEVT